MKESTTDVPSNSEATRRISFFSNSLFMDMPPAPTVHNMLSFSGPATECFVFHARAAEASLFDEDVKSTKVMCIELVGNWVLRRMVRVLVATAIREAAAGAEESSPADHLRSVFYRMGLNDKEIVALSGALTLGRSIPDRSGWGKLETKYTKDGPYGVTF